MSLDKCERIALRVRELLANELIQHNTQVFSADFACACAVSNWFLKRVLKYHGIKTTFALGRFSGDYHAFLLLNEGDTEYVLDIAATQFRQYKKCPVAISGLENSLYFVETSGMSARKALRSWPSDQHPNTYNKELKRIFNSLKKIL